MSSRWIAACAGIVAVCIAMGARSALAQEAAGAPDPEPDPWEARVALGGSLRAGDESRYSGNADGMLLRRFDVDTWTWTAVGDYGKTGGERDAENFGTNLEWRHAFNGRFFWLSNAGADHDAVQGRNLRLLVNTGPGYRIWEASEKRFFDVSTGVGYRHERFRGDEFDNNLIEGRAGYEYRDIIGETLEIVHQTDVFAPANEIEAFLAKSELTLSVPLVGGLHFRNNARYEYVNQPADDNEESNFWLTIGLEYRL